MKLRCLTVIALAAVVAPAAAHPDDPDRTLSAKEVQTYFEPYVPDVRQCYADHARGRAAAGELRLELIIHPNGAVVRFGFSAPGVEKPWLRRLDTCLRRLVPSWRFPSRHGFTSAVLPFFLQRTNAPGAGPIESCWDLRGCPPGKLRGKK